MLKIRDGDLFEGLSRTGNNIIVHGCNAQGAMASGFAAALIRHYPMVFQTYRDYYCKHGLKVGDQVLHFVDDSLVIVNAITQEYYGRAPSRVYVDYEAVRKGLDCAVGVQHVGNSNPSCSSPWRIHLPFIGGGLANGDRDVLMAIFQACFKHADATLWIN